MFGNERILDKRGDIWVSLTINLKNFLDEIKNRKKKIDGGKIRRKKNRIIIILYYIYLFISTFFSLFFPFKSWYYASRPLFYPQNKPRFISFCDGGMFVFSFKIKHLTFPFKIKGLTLIWGIFWCRIRVVLGNFFRPQFI